ncbi:MAG TPA: DUF1990 family protein [Roseiflexaceae bacterium]|nr:DUF1990 family protein [Roseiflexaceae bacterium]
MSNGPRTWWQRDDTPLWQRYQARLDALRDAPVNFDLDRQHEYTQQNGWHVDDYVADLIDEPPGPPLPDGPWEIGCRMLREYRFPDPGIVTGIYVPDSPLEKRVMLLRARAYCMTFFFGVRVANIKDTTEQGQHGPQRVWGYSYQTLRGHYEQGQMDFSIVKELESGKIQFRIHAFSKAGRIPNPIIRFGFHLLGRRVQIKFAKRALERMQNLVQEELKRQAGAEPATPTETPPVRPASQAPAEEQHKAH